MRTFAGIDRASEAHDICIVDERAARVALGNQPRAQLAAFWPGATRIFSDLDSPISLASLQRSPSPADAHRLGARRMQAFLDRHHDCGRKRADELLGRLRTHPHGHIFKSFLRDPTSAITPARLLAEIGDCRTRYPTAASMTADAGMTPVTIHSGKRRTAAIRYGRDARLRNATVTPADSTRHRHPWATDTYHRAIARGHDHPHAIRTLGRNRTLVLWRCRQDSVPDNPAQHRAAQRHLTPSP